MMIHKRKITADEDILDTPVATDGAGDVDVDPKATDLLFEAEDVAELVAEVTGEPVEVEVDDDGNSVKFTVGEDEFNVEAEGNEEILESVRTRKKAVKASTDAAKKSTGRVIKKFPKK